ncbi:MAG: hypothetical protein WD990_08615 [Acidimicrobiia bacterium]
MQQARLIPVSGIGSVAEAEQRASSALLAVLSIVRDLSIDLLSPLGASRAQKADIEAYTEVGFEYGKQKIRPDGLIRISFGKSSWSALVEVKTGDHTLSADQINQYWDVARENGIDHVLTISNEIAPNEDIHPTPGLKVRSNSKVDVTHLSWTAILTSAVRLKQHAGVSDPEQAWILGELIRYLEHPRSGALSFEDMGPEWVTIRDTTRSGTLTKRTDGVEDVCGRWDQLIRFAALKLGSEIGEDVAEILSRTHRDPKQRLAHLVGALTTSGVVDGALRIPNTAGDLEVTADLRAQHLTAAVEVNAPQDKGAKGRISWLLGQLKDAPRNLVIEAYPKNARTPTSATLGDLNEDRSRLIGEDRKEAHKFRIVMHAEMGKGRKTGTKNTDFISSVLNLIDDFYGTVIQNITPWQAPAPKLKKPTQLTTPAEHEEDSEEGKPLIAQQPPPPWSEP